MKRSLLLSLLPAAALGLAWSSASAGPVSSCSKPVNGSLSCNLFETDANGTSSENGFLLNVGVIIFSPGFFIIREDANNNDNADTDPTHWSDLVYFTQKTVQLLSDPSEAGFVTPITTADGKTFTAAQIVAGALGYIGEVKATQVFSVGNASGTGMNSFKTHSDPAVPEPSSLGVLTVGALGLLYGTRRWRRR